LRGGRGWSLVEVLVALCLVGSAGVLASGAAHSLSKLARAARSEAAGLAAAMEKLEEVIALSSDLRSPGNDEVITDDLAVTRIWRVQPGAPTKGLDRVEVTARWLHPAPTLLTLVAVAP
jgi:type II secretory pathway pseudopilin PulG